MRTAICNRMIVNYKLLDALICENGTLKKYKNGKCVRTSFLLAKGLQQDVILGTPFLLNMQVATIFCRFSWRWDFLENSDINSLNYAINKWGQCMCSHF